MTDRVNHGSYRITGRYRLPGDGRRVRGHPLVHAVPDRGSTKCEVVDVDAYCSQKLKASPLDDRTRHSTRLDSEAGRPVFDREIPTRLDQGSIDATAASLGQN